MSEPRRLPVVGVGSSGALRPDGRRVAIHPIDVRGRFLRARRVVFAVLLVVYLALPLVPIGGHPAVHLDVPARKFFLFGGTFNAQDVWIVVLGLLAVAFALLFVTAWRGRLWCGWACPQTVFLEGIFRPIERLFEGPRSRRLRLANAPWTVERALRTGGKHLAYLLAALVIGHVTVSIFVTAHDLAAMVRGSPAANATSFGWTAALTGVVYFEFAWFREQFCVVLCPYGRLQSVLHDADSVVIGYDARRGEPRGKLRREPPAAAPKTGDCVACDKCVAACPTAIDIRNGFQMECLACAQCIDACDEVMDKVGRPRGLIRYAAENELLGRPHRVARPRLYVYGALFAAALVALGLAVGGRTPFESNVVRAPGVPWVREGGRTRNQFDVHLVNKHPETGRFAITVEGPPDAEIMLGAPEVELPSLGDVRIPIVLALPDATARRKPVFVVRITDRADGTTRTREVPFLAPP